MLQTIQLTEQDSKKILLLKDKGSMLADDYVNVDQEGKKKFGQILTEWVKLIEEEKQLGSFTLPDHLVSSYIRGELRARNVSDWALNYVPRILESKYKDKNHDPAKYEPSSTGATNDNQIPWMDNISKNFLSDEQFDKLSPAEQQQYIYDISERNKRAKKVINDQEKRNEELAEKYHIPIKIVQRAEKPPEWFWGESQLFKDLDELANDIQIFYKYIIDAKGLCYKFRPTGEVDKEASAAMRSYYENEWKNYKLYNIYVIEKLLTQFIKVVDEKNRETARGWFKIGEDKFLNFGSHGAGVLNSIDIGKSILEYKDGEVYSHDLERPFTKEIVSDNTKGKLVVEAHKFSQGCKIEAAINKWVKETHCDIVITDPTQFMREVTRDPNVQVITDIHADKNKEETGN
ncbi:MAG TPA: hypothetical protein VF220_01415 [Nitrososphaeraceae archaeon]